MKNLLQDINIEKMFEEAIQQHVTYSAVEQKNIRRFDECITRYVEILCNSRKKIMLYWELVSISFI